MLSELDCNLLEAYLDDSLSATEVERLDCRLCEEPELSHTFTSLKSERAARIAMFHAMAPDESHAARFADNALASIRRRQWQGRFTRNLRIFGAVAACLIVGFAVGWMGRGRSAATQLATLRSSLTTPESSIAPAHSHNDGHLVMHAPKAPEPGVYQVAVMDADGNVIALQRFAKQEDARQFADDLGQFELRRQQVQESQPVLVSDSF